MSDLEAFKIERDRLKLILEAENSLHAFVKLAWSQIEGNKPFIDGWHIAAICEHLEACIYGQIKALLINIPPRMSKTSLITILFPAWAWIRYPYLKFLYASYGHTLSKEHSRNCKGLIESPWYRDNWGDIFELSKDQSTKSHFTNTKLGYRLATSVKGVATGLGGDILVCLPYNTLIDTENGRLFIGDIVRNKWQVKVWSFDELADLIELAEIEAFEQNHSDELVQIELDDRILECTSNHPVFVEGKGYVSAGDIKQGDIVLCLTVSNVDSK